MYILTASSFDFTLKSPHSPPSSYLSRCLFSLVLVSILAALNGILFHSATFFCRPFLLSFFTSFAFSLLMLTPLFVCRFLFVLSISHLFRFLHPHFNLSSLLGARYPLFLSILFLLLYVFPNFLINCTLFLSILQQASPSSIPSSFRFFSTVPFLFLLGL